MGKTLFYRMFKFGRIPKKLRHLLEVEGVIVADEGVAGWYVTNNLKAPWKRIKHRREGFSGFLVITRRRIIAHTNWKRQINISVEDPKISALHTRLVDSQRIALAFESSSFHSDWQGVIELHFNTSKASEFYEALIRAGVQRGTPADPGTGTRSKSG